MIVQVGAKIGGNGFGDFESGELDAGLSNRVTQERGGHDGVRRPSVEKSLDLPIAHHAVEQAGPAGALAGGEHRTDQWKSSRWLDQQPRRAVRDALPVQFGQPPFEIIVHQRDCQVRRLLDDVNTKFAQGGRELGGSLNVDRLNAYATIPEIFLCAPGRQAEARPIAGDGA